MTILNLEDGQTSPSSRFCFCCQLHPLDRWQRNNLWIMFNALASDARRLTLVALYNPERDPEGLGGTAHLVQTASTWGFKTVELDARELRKV